MEAFDLAVGLGPVGAGLSWGDAELFAGIAPGVGFLGRAVVGEDPLDPDAAGLEPGHCPAENPDRGDGFLVVMDLGVGDPGVVIDDAVNERGPDLGLTVFRSWFAWCGGTIPVALRASNVSPAAGVGDVSELFDVDVDHRPGVVVFVTAHDLTGADVDVVELVHPAPGQHGVNGRGGHSELAGDPDGPESFPPTERDDSFHHVGAGPVRGAVGP